MAWQSRRFCVLLAMAFAVVLAGTAAVAVAQDEASQEIIKQVIEALRGDDPEMQTGAITIVREIPGAEVTKALTQELPKLPAAAQVQLLSALADRGDALALPAVVEQVKSPDESVRVAALKAVGQLGGGASVPLLAQQAAVARGAEQRAARESLYRLRGAEVDAAILENVVSAAPGVKVELVSAIGERNIGGAVRALLATAAEDNRKVRLESFKVLRIIARPDDLPALVNLLLEVKSDSDRNEAEKMVAAVAHKIEEKGRQATAVLAILPNVKEATGRASLLRTLGRIGDGSALPILQAALTSREPEIQDAAIRALADWPTPEPVPDLVKVAQTTENKVHKVLALRGFVRLLSLDGSRPADEAIDLYRKAMELAGDAAEKKRVLSGLSSAKSVAALTMAAQYLDDITLHMEAESAAVQIAQATAGSDPQQTKEVLRKVIQSTKNDTLRQRAQQILDQTDRFEDYIVAWLASGPYTKENVDGQGLFDVAFAPEQEVQPALWRLVSAGTNEQRPWLIELEKDAALNGENRVAYLRARVWSPKEQKAQLELGSDDGVKVWLNGQLVHANNVIRPTEPGQDKAPVTLKEGWNPLLVKLTQGDGQWSLCMRFRSPDGAKLEGLKSEPQ
ncbi:MAG: HEAT repeat domain-containing protein [Sedimentisphaerales bacterium]|nr:HEAT repeat domain-containing protein [Sedimentisphaerales bacterium]